MTYVVSDEIKLLRSVGEQLYGKHWDQLLPAALRVSYTTLRRWNNGSQPIPKGVWRDLELIIEVRMGALTDLQRSLELPVTARA
jgi:hypothetical protein